MKVYPAYGRTIAALIARGVKPAAVGVLLSSRWGYYEHAARVCIKPDEWAPGRWEFGFLRNMHAVALIGDDVEPWQFGGLLIDLMLAGPRLLWFADTQQGWIYKEDFALTVRDYACVDIRGSLIDEKAEGREWKGPRVYDFTTKIATTAYQAAQRRALDEEGRIAARIQQKGRDPMQWWIERQRQLQFVEQLFGDPYQVPEDAAAA